MTSKTFNVTNFSVNSIKTYYLLQKLSGGTRTDRQAAGDLLSLTFIFRESRLK
jgi:hypothetical protein